MTMGLHNALYGAEIFTLIGEPARALASLALAARLGLGCAALVGRHSRALAPLRAEPGFAAILEGVVLGERGVVPFSTDLGQRCQSL